MPHLADLARRNQLPRLLQRRNIAVTQVHHIDERGLLGGGCHFIGQREILGQRLFAQHMLLRRDDLHRRRMMHGIGRHVGDGIELSPGQQRIEAAECVGDAMLLREALGAGLIGIGGCHHIDAGIGLEQPRVIGGHRTGAENGETDLAHR